MKEKIITIKVNGAAQGQWSSLLLELNLMGENTEDHLSAINSAIEDFAIKNISEYFWIHRRFKNRPEGERNFYPDEALREKLL